MLNNDSNENDHRHPVRKDDQPVSVVYNNFTYYIQAPEGEMNIAILEDGNGNPVRLWVHCGKAGSTLNAWIDAFVRVASMQMERGLLSINQLREELSSTTSDKSVTNLKTGVIVSSGLEAIYVALTKYQNDKYAELDAKLDAKSKKQFKSSSYSRD